MDQKQPPLVESISHMAIGSAEAPFRCFLQVKGGRMIVCDLSRQAVETLYRNLHAFMEQQKA